MQVLSLQRMLAPGSCGGYGVGLEPLPAVMAARGCEVVATDYDLESAQPAGWADTGQCAVHTVNDGGICDPALFGQRVRFRVIDVNAIPDDLSGFKFTWSSCALEHLGSIANGLRFIKGSLRPSPSGGIAVHTTEFNCTSNVETIDKEGAVLIRRRDFEELAAELRAERHQIELKFNRGNSALDNYVGLPPCRASPHLK